MGEIKKMAALVEGSLVKIGFLPEVFDMVQHIKDYQDGMYLVETMQGYTCWVQYIPATHCFTLAFNHAHSGLDEKLNCAVCNPLREGLELPPLKSRY